MAAPIRGTLNAANSFMGGDPNYFRPSKGMLSDAIGLPKPETEAERRMFSFNESAASALSGAFVLGGTRAGMEAVNLAGKAVEKGIEKAVQYAPVVYNAAVSTAKAAYDKARPVVQKTATTVRDTSRDLLLRDVGKSVQVGIDIVEGAFMPGPPIPATKAKLFGYGTIKGAELIKQHPVKHGLDHGHTGGSFYNPYQNQIRKQERQ